MDLIDWYVVGFGALWIFGLSLNLAALSLADFERQRQHRRFRDIWAGRSYQIASNLGLTFFCWGWAGLTRDTWECLIWLFLGLGFLFFAFKVWRTKT